MGCCLVAVIGALWPRVLLVILWLFTQVLNVGFAGVENIWPFLGFLFLPATTLAYALIKYFGHPIDSAWIVWLALGFVYDLGTFSGVRGRRTVVVKTDDGKRAKFVDPG